MFFKIGYGLFYLALRALEVHRSSISGFLPRAHTKIYHTLLKAVFFKVYSSKGGGPGGQLNLYLIKSCSILFKLSGTNNDLLFIYS